MCIFYRPFQQYKNLNFMKNQNFKYLLCIIFLFIFSCDEDDISDNNLVFKIQEKEIYDKKIHEEDLYIIIFKEEDEIVDKLLSVKEINEDHHKLSLIDEEQNDITIHLEDKTNRIILKTDEYEIIDM